MTDVTGALTRAAPIRASSWNADEGTFDIVISGGAAVSRRDARGLYDEVLQVSGATWPDRLPVLDTHRRSSLDDQLGEAFNVRLEGSELVATIRLSKHSARAQRVAADLSDGVTTFRASIGYDVPPGATTEGKQGGRRTKTASRFHIHEISLVSIPADPAASIRSAEMPELTREQIETRNAEILAIAVRAGLDAAWANKHIVDGNDLDAVRASALEALTVSSAAAAQTRSHHNEQTRDNPQVRVRAIGEALYARAAVGHTPSDLAREFVDMSVRDIARDLLARSGELTTGLSDAALYERSLMTTSDFPKIFADVANRSLNAAYQAAPSGIRQVAKQSTAKDFRTKTSISLANKITLTKVNEHGEFKNSSLVEASETYSVDTFGTVLGLTRKMLVNDDIGAFVDAAGRLGQAAAGFEADFLYNKISANPTMSDGKAVFHADHGNLATGAALSVASLSIARQKLRAQTDAGSNLIAITPKYLVVGPALETLAEQVLSDIAAASVDAVNPFAGKLTLVVEPRMTGLQWYVTADPGQVAGLEYSYLAGSPGPQIASQIGFRIDGIEYRVSLDYGAGWTDFRGWVKTPAA